MIISPLSLPTNMDMKRSIIKKIHVHEMYINLN